MCSAVSQHKKNLQQAPFNCRIATFPYSNHQHMDTKRTNRRKVRNKKYKKNKHCDKICGLHTKCLQQQIRFDMRPLYIMCKSKRNKLSIDYVCINRKEVLNLRIQTLYVHLHKRSFNWPCIYIVRPSIRKSFKVVLSIYHVQIKKERRFRVAVYTCYVTINNNQV